jgi:hypothetical protein
MAESYMKKCFVIMPFSQTTPAHNEAYWFQFFENFIKPALHENGYIAEKSVAAPNNITKQIVRELAMADLVLAVLTDGKPNVFYELGVRHSLRQGTIMILEEEGQRPFDISNYGILSYRGQDLPKFTADLGHYIKVAEKMSEDSPVADFLNQRITVSVNLALGRLRQSVQILRGKEDFNAALEDLRGIQHTWTIDREQVNVVVDGQLVLHADSSLERAFPTEKLWQDEMSDNKSLYPMMQERLWGFRIAQIKDKKGRLTALAFETIDRPARCLVVAEAHYHQESRPY